MREPAGVLPTMRWSLIVTATTLAALCVLLYGLALAASTLAPYLAATNVKRITLERSGCFGSCPAYTLALESSGRASYVGNAFVRYRGTYETHFGGRFFPRFAEILYHRGMFASRSLTRRSKTPR